MNDGAGLPAGAALACAAALALSSRPDRRLLLLAALGVAAGLAFGTPRGPLGFAAVPLLGAVPPALIARRASAGPVASRTASVLAVVPLAALPILAVGPTAGAAAAPIGATVAALGLLTAARGGRWSGLTMMADGIVLAAAQA